jgi:peptidoglycan hydrolase CwlO-like protein
MSETMIQTLITTIVTLIGTFGGILTAQKLSNYRIQELEKKVDKHNNVIEKTYGLEKEIQDMRKDLDKVDAEHQKTKEKVLNMDKRVTILEKERG